MFPWDILQSLLGLGGGGDPTPDQIVQASAATGMPASAFSGSTFGSPDPNAAAAPAGALSMQNLLPFLLKLLMLGGGMQYGNNELQALSQIYGGQKQAAAMALGVAPGQLANQAARFALPLNKTLAYQTTNAADANTALHGMIQSPGATAAGEAGALAPYVQSNVTQGTNLATSADQIALQRLQYPFAESAPNQLGVLQQLEQLGTGSAIPPYLYGGGMGYGYGNPFGSGLQFPGGLP